VLWWCAFRRSDAPGQLVGAAYGFRPVNKIIYLFRPAQGMMLILTSQLIVIGEAARVGRQWETGVAIYGQGSESGGIAKMNSNSQAKGGVVHKTAGSRSKTRLERKQCCAAPNTRMRTVQSDSPPTLSQADGVTLASVCLPRAVYFASVWACAGSCGSMPWARRPLATPPGTSEVNTCFSHACTLKT
jgi:hypothetical protein